MKKRNVGITGIEVSEIGLGCASYWGKVKFNEAVAIRIVHMAADAGVNLFDTGHSYSDGNAESRLGKAIVGLPNKSALVISTKAGTRIGNNGRLFKDFSSGWIRKSCHQSLSNLGIESIPLFHLHGPTTSDLSDDLIDQVIRMKADGLIKAIGVNSFDDKVLEKILDLNVFDFVMPDYNILSQQREPLIEKFNAKGIAVLAGAALADSLYSNRVFRIGSMKDAWYLARALKNFRGKLIRGFNYRFINNQPNITGAQVALAYVLRNKMICSALFGTTSEEHLLENLAAANISLPDDLVNRIQECGSQAT